MTNYPAWNEKQWENEIRKHESSLAEFFRDLVYCLDLPIGEMPSVLQNSTADAPLDPVTSRSKEALQLLRRAISPESMTLALPLLVRKSM